MFQYFLVMSLLLSIAPLLRQRPKLAGIIALLLVSSSLYTATLIGQVNAHRPAIVETTAEVVRRVKEHFKSHGNSCFGGIFDPQTRSQLNAAVNIALIEYSCGWLEGKPVYWSTGESGDVREIQIPRLIPNPRNLKDELDRSYESTELTTYLTSLPYNVKEAEKGLRHDGITTFKFADKEINTRQIEATFKIVDSFPELLNTGLVRRAGENSLFFLFLNNMFRVLLVDRTGAVQELASTQINQILPSFSFRIIDTNQGCLFLYNEQLLTQIGRCLPEKFQLGYFGVENGTPIEELVHLSVQ